MIWDGISGVSLKWWYPTIHPVKSSGLVLDSFCGTSSVKNIAIHRTIISSTRVNPDAWLNPNELKWYSSRSISFLLPLSLYVFVWLYMFHSFIYIIRYQEMMWKLTNTQYKAPKRVGRYQRQVQGLLAFLASQAFLPKILKQGQAMGREKRISPPKSYRPLYTGNLKPHK